METVYGEKEALDDALTSVKTATGNYNTFSNECVHENVRNVMLKILEQEHEIQDDVFKIMHDKGLYPTPEAESKKVEQNLAGRRSAPGICRKRSSRSRSQVSAGR